MRSDLTNCMHACMHALCVRHRQKTALRSGETNKMNRAWGVTCRLPSIFLHVPCARVPPSISTMSCFFLNLQCGHRAERRGRTGDLKNGPFWLLYNRSCPAVYSTKMIIDSSKDPHGDAHVTNQNGFVDAVDSAGFLGKRNHCWLFFSGAKTQVQLSTKWRK